MVSSTKVLAVDQEEGPRGISVTDVGKLEIFTFFVDTSECDVILTSVLFAPKEHHLNILHAITIVNHMRSRKDS